MPGRFRVRAGGFVDLRTLLDEVGRDAARVFFVLRRADTPLTFDLTLARQASVDNPVYYLQYGHARVASILRRATEHGHAVPDWRPELAHALHLPEELDLARRVLAFPALLESAALAREPHHLAAYLLDAIRSFHAYEKRYRRSDPIGSDEPEKRDARLFLVDCLRIVLVNALGLLGVPAPDRMDAPAGLDDDEP